jgi:hypothetical protein
VNETDRELFKKLFAEDGGLLKDWCDACHREYNEDCWACLLWGFLDAVEKHYTKGWTMNEAMRNYMRKSPPPDGAKERVEKVIGAPLHVVKMILKEIEDYEKYHDV